MSRLDKRAMLACVLLVLGVVVVFGETARHDFVNFDDDRYVYDNEHIKPGLTLNGLGYYLVHRHSYTYHPVTSISHMLDCQLFGVDAGRHHAISVLLHAVTAVGLFLVLWQMTGRLWPSAMVAAVFALHPLRVESVAWISERRDVLSGLFFVLALWAYVRYLRRPHMGKYVALCVLFALGLLAKPMLVTLPLLLLLLDYWPLERISGRRVPPASGYPAGDARDEGALREAVETPNDGGTQVDVPCETHLGRLPDRRVRGAWDAREEGALCEAVETTSDGGTQVDVPCETHQLPTASLPAPCRLGRGLSLRGLLVEKIPLLAISLAASLITVYTQADGGAVQSLESVSLAARIVNTPIAYANYVGSFFWPQRLAVLYPHPCDNYDLHGAIVKGCLLIMASAVFALLWRRMPYLLVGWLWYLGTLVPVIGLLQVGGASMADRYTYLPQIGLAIAVVWTATAAADRLRRNAVYVILALASVAILTALAAAAWRQTASWRNSETLWTRELSFPQYDNSVAHYNFGLALADQGRHREAVQQFAAAVAFDPKDEDNRLNLGHSYEALDSADAAIEQYRAIVANNAKSVAGHNNLARLLQARGDDRHAAEQLRAAHDEEPSNRDTCIRLALLLATSPDAAVRNGREALALARKAVELTKGKDAAALDARAAAEAETGDFKAATDDAKAAMKLATAGGDKKLAGEIRPRLDRYREDKPFRAKTVRPGPGIGLRSPGQ